MDAPSDPPSIASQTTTVDAHAMHYLAEWLAARIAKG
jgi:hypothetical protein